MKNRDITNQLVHITYRTHGSISNKDLNKLDNDYQRDKSIIFSRYKVKERLPGKIHNLTFHHELETLHLNHYQEYERLLHQTGRRSYFLESDEAKQIIIDSWQFIAQQKDLILYAICVMSNHVHVLLRARKEDDIHDFDKLLGDHKRWVANQLNKLVGATGRRVFSSKDFDRDVRPGRFASVLLYILKNPLKAGITTDWLSFPGNWFDPRLEDEFIQPYRIGLAA